MRTVALISIFIAQLVMNSMAHAQSSGRGAQPLDAASTEALQKTQNLLFNPEQRAQAMKNDPKALANDAKVKSSLGDQTQPAYELSAQVLETIVKKTNGDPRQMQEIVNQLMTNPQLLEQYLTPQQRDQIRSMASQIEKQQGHAPTAPAH